MEFDPFHAALADKLVDWAGLRSKVSVVIGDSGKIIPQLKDRFGGARAFRGAWRALLAVTRLR